MNLRLMRDIYKIIMILLVSRHNAKFDSSNRLPKKVIVGGMNNPVNALILINYTWKSENCQSEINVTFKNPKIAVYFVKMYEKLSEEALFFENFQRVIKFDLK